MLFDLLNMDGVANVIVNGIPYGEPLGEVGDILRKRFDETGTAIADKTGQMLALLGIFAAPIVIVFFLLIGKIAYDLFTGAADTIGDAIVIAKYKLKTNLKLLFTKIRSLISPKA